jgi:hypothetical protein
VRIVGWIGIGTSLLAFVTAAILIWWRWDDYSMMGPGSLYMTITKTFAISSLAAVSFAHANLLLLLANTPIRWMRIALDLNLVLIALVALFVVPVILSDGDFPPQSLADVYWRMFGIILILDALGTVALPVTSLIVRSQRRAAGLDNPKVDVVTITLRGATAAWVVQQAANSKSTPLEVLDKLVAGARKK